MIKLVREYLNDYLKENKNLNEKFTEDSDPIKDLDIGIIRKRGGPTWKILDYIQKAGNEGRRYSEIVKYHYESNYRKTMNMGLFDTINRYTDENIRKTRHRYVLNDRGLNYLEKNRGFFESLNEKFTEDSDPIHDMGIGSTWETLKIGDIIYLKTNIQGIINNKGYYYIEKLQIDVKDKMKNLYGTKFTNKIELINFLHKKPSFKLLFQWKIGKAFYEENFDYIGNKKDFLESQK
jgi:hypothetical protein